MKALVIEDYDSKINEYLYEKGQTIRIAELEGFDNNYAIYRYDGLDWIPKKLVQILQEESDERE